MFRILPILFLVACVPAFAGDKIIIRNAQIFDGVSEQLSEPQDLLIDGNIIADIGINLQAEGARIIDARGLTLTPGFIDSHSHLMLQLSFFEGISSDEYFYAYNAARTAETVLMNGFTTVRDMSGNIYSLKKAIDRGIVKGPRIFPSGPMISQTAGHSDHRFDAHLSRMVSDKRSVFMDYDMVQVADGDEEVLRASRESLRRLASQIKIAVSGGVTSLADPIDVIQYTPAEIQAAVQVAKDYGTYVAAHAYTDAAIGRAIDGGVRTIEHGNLATAQILRRMKQKNVWLSPQVIIFVENLKGLNPIQKKKMDEVAQGLDRLFIAAREVGFENIVFGTDIVMDPNMVAGMNTEFVHRTKWFSPVEILRQATSKGGAVLALSGDRAPYAGKLGVIEKGALADILLIRGNPLKDIKVLTDPAKNIPTIIKDGKVVKNSL